MEDLTKYREKIASITGHIVDFRKGPDTTRVSLNLKNGLIQDIYGAVKNYNKDDQLKKYRRRVLLGAAALGTGIGLGLYSQHANKLLTKNVSAIANNMGKAKTLAAKLPVALMAGGAYGAYMNRHPKTEFDRKQRNLSYAALATGLLSTPITAKLIAKADTTKAVIPTNGQLARVVGGLGLIAGGTAAATHAGQVLQNIDDIKHIMQSERNYNKAAERINRIEEKKTLNTRYPILRAFNNVPIVGKFIDTNIGKVHNTMSDNDERQYIAAQEDAVFKELKRGFEALNKRVTDRDIDKLHTKAFKIVEEEIKKAKQ